MRRRVHLDTVNGITAYFCARRQLGASRNYGVAVSVPGSLTIAAPSGVTFGFSASTTVTPTFEVQLTGHLLKPWSELSFDQGYGNTTPLLLFPNKESGKKNTW
jgi:hypothetical protein